MKRKSALKSTAALALAIAAGSIVSASGSYAADAHMQQILERGVVRVGVLGAFKPWSFPAPDGTMQGIEIDLAQSVADALGVKLEPVIITSANRMQFLEQGKIDVIIGGMYDTAERRKVVGMIEPAYWSSGPTLLTKEGAIKDWKDVAGKPVCGKQGVYYNKMVEIEYKAKVVAFTGNTEGKEALRSGKCVGWLYDDASIMADLASGEWEGYEMPVSVLFSNPWAAAVPLEEKDKALGAFMTGMAYRWQASGKLIELEKKWKVKPSDWIAAQNEKAKWDTSYLEAN
ncbi:transporter substrate-binding domain-containing protein [Nitratireductor indicus]|uniref:transporter substrate-binding domain-containing protein n=1 Tax=Nitratireductor indicus TaxID=721133 RepID=UPI00287539A7|nr:transporter substrate-binding domain-containing protein [Nitratireductor indicus]MDS1138375.1 transporter substrate-binding domain-containing protein [Nitratireductor indicus]